MGGPYSRNMMNLMHSGQRRARQPKREILQEVGLSALSITAALILLPAVGTKALVHAVFTTKGKSADADRTHYLIQ